jgi:hypothetical protein
MRAAWFLAVAAVIVSSAGAFECFAQGTPDTSATTAAKPASPTGDGESAPTKVQGLIAALSGKWLLSVRFEPTSGMPNAFTGSGEESWHEGPGGFTLIEEEHLPTPGGQGYLLGIFWWDSIAKKLQGMECNNQLPYTCDLKGALADITVTWDEKTLAIEELETHDGKKTIWHEAWSQITPASFVQTGDVTQPDGSTHRYMTIKGAKVKE